MSAAMSRVMQAAYCEVKCSNRIRSCMVLWSEGPASMLVELQHPPLFWPTANACSILVANNGLAAVKFISYLRRWANNTFGHDRVVRPSLTSLLTHNAHVHRPIVAHSMQSWCAAAWLGYLTQPW